LVRVVYVHVWSTEKRTQRRQFTNRDRRTAATVAGDCQRDALGSTPLPSQNEPSSIPDFITRVFGCHQEPFLRGSGRSNIHTSGRGGWHFSSNHASNQVQSICSADVQVGDRDDLANQLDCVFIVHSTGRRRR